MDIKIIYEDKDLLVVDKPAGLVTFPEGENLKSKEKTLIDLLIEKYPELVEAGLPPRYGVVHRLDKDTSGILMVAKTNESLIFLQKQFSTRGVSPLGGINTDAIEKNLEKGYITLAEGNIKQDAGEIKTLIARSSRDPRKQTVYELNDPKAPKSAREAVTEYKVLERFSEYTLLEVQIKTGRKHQIRCHLSYLQHPIAGDKMYGFKNSKTPNGLTRQFLHAKYLKITLPNGEVKGFTAELPEELQKVLDSLKIL